MRGSSASAATVPVTRSAHAAITPDRSESVPGTQISGNTSAMPSSGRPSCSTNRPSSTRMLSGCIPMSGDVTSIGGDATRRAAG